MHASMQVQQIAALSTTTRAGSISRGISGIPTAKQKRHTAPLDVWDKATVVEDEENRYQWMDVVWHYIASMIMPDSGLCYPRLSKIGLEIGQSQCIKFKPPNELLKRVKSATWEYNKEHSKK